VLMKGLKQSTVATVIVGPVLDSTGAAVTNAVVGDFRLAKNGTVATLSGATVTHDANGYYLIALTTGNTDTTGRLVLTSGNTAHSMASHHWSVLPASVFDAIYTNATNSTGGLATATGNITALAGAVSTLTAPQVRTELATELGRIDQKISSRATQTSVDAIDDFVDTEVAAIKAKTDLIVAFPDNFGSLGIDPGGAILLVNTVDELGAGALTANNAGDPIADIVWNALTTATWANNSFGKQVLIGASTQRTVAVTGSHHVAAVLHDAEPDSIPEDAFQSGALSARVIGTDAIDSDAMAASANTEIANAVAATQALSRLDSMIESDGAGQFRFDTIALEMAPAGGGGGGTDWTANERTAIRSILGIPTSGTTPTDPAVGILDEIRDDINAIGINVYPVQASTPERVQGTTLTFYRNESRSVSVVTDFTLTSLTLQFTVEDADGVDVYTLANGSISRSAQTFTVAVTTAVTGNLGQYRWSMRDISGGGSSVVAMGVLTVQEAASNV
jgi:hypothetical protein